MTSSPPTRAKSLHAAEGPRLPNPGNSRSTPYHDGCRPQPWWLRHDNRGLKFRQPSATGLRLGNPRRAPHGGDGRPVPTWSWQTPGQESLPTPPAKGVGDDRAATRLFSWDARRHPVAQVPQLL